MMLMMNDAASKSRHSSVQGESEDSDSEVLTKMSTNLRNIIVSNDSGDDSVAESVRDVDEDKDDDDDDDDDAFDSSQEKPVFLTSKGPVPATIGTSLHVIHSHMLDLLFYHSLGVISARWRMYQQHFVCLFFIRAESRPHTH